MLFNFKFKSVTIFLLLFASYTFAQTGIGTATPHASAKLHVSATDKGFLPPRVTLTTVTDATTIPSPAEGLLVYNLGSVGLQAGYYYWNGSSWATIATASSPDQTVDFVSVVRTSSQTVNSTSSVLFDSIIGGTIPYNSSTGMFTLIAGRTYRLTGVIALSSGNTSAAEVNVRWRTATGTFIGNRGEALSTNFITTAFGSGIADVIFTPAQNTTVSLYVTYATQNAILWENFTYANIQQIGSSAIVNPWILSGNDVYNTSGNVGIGTNAPNSRLDVTGNVNIAGALNVNGSSNVNIQTPGLLVGSSSGDEGGEIQLAPAQTNQSLSGRVIVDVYRNQLRFLESGGSARGINIDLSKAPAGASGELIWKTSGFVNAGTFISLDNLKVAVTTSGSRGLSIGAVATTFEADVSGWYGGANVGGAGSSANNQTYTTTGSNSTFGWSFPAHGDTAQYHIRDKTNNRFYRVIMMIGAGYISNFISIERLF